MFFFVRCVVVAVKDLFERGVVPTVMFIAETLSFMIFQKNKLNLSEMNS